MVVHVLVFLVLVSSRFLSVANERLSVLSVSLQEPACGAKPAYCVRREGAFRHTWGCYAMARRS
eukprot:7102220-Alexandrium_andersonii.AAC.1